MNAAHNQFKNQYVRDLAWAISAPCVAQNNLTPSNDFFAAAFAEALPVLKALDKNPLELVEFIQKSKRKSLGTYFEDLIEFWLAHRNNTKILARNLQIIDDKTTLGECDFITEIDGEVTHIEVAIKYYLAIKNSSEQKFWVGRGLTDRLDIKLKKLFEQQLELSGNKTMLDQLKQNNIAKITQKMAIIKGYFFKHYFIENHALPELAPTNIEQSFWCRVSEIDKLPEPYSKWQILTKPHWLTYSDEWFDRSELREKALEYFATVKDTPVLCNAISADSFQPTKFFISGDSWSAETV